MRKRIALICVVAILFCCGMAYAATISNELQEGRYILIMQNGRAVRNTRIPAIILDSYQGVIWTCQNLQDGRPLWVSTDLGQNGRKQITKKKYIARMLEWQDSDLRMPAVVLDIDDGIVWNCPNIVDGQATWIQKDLKIELPEKVSPDAEK